VKDIHDVIKHAKFGDYRWRGSGVVADQISAFPIDFAGRPYNTLTLPCERVIRQVVLEHVQYENCIDLQMTWEARGSSLKFCQIFDKLCQNGPVDPISFFWNKDMQLS